MTQHGDVRQMPAHVLDTAGTCDWGDCDALATRLRFDAYGHGWLPVCDRCALRPVMEPGDFPAEPCGSCGVMHGRGVFMQAFCICSPCPLCRPNPPSLPPITTPWHTAVYRWDEAENRADVSIDGELPVVVPPPGAPWPTSSRIPGQAPCSVCRGPLDDGTIIGTGRGDGQSFAHAVCYWRDRGRRTLVVLGAYLKGGHHEECRHDWPALEDRECTCGYEAARRLLDTLT